MYRISITVEHQRQDGDKTRKMRTFTDFTCPDENLACEVDTELSLAESSGGQVIGLAVTYEDGPN